MSLIGLQITSAAATPLITTAEAKTFLRVDGSSEDSLIDFFVESVTLDIENYIKRALITQTFKLTIDRFNCSSEDEYDVFGPGIHNVPRSIITDSDFIYLPRAPIQSVTSITTYDEAHSGTVFSSANYTLDTQNGRVFLDSGSTWPTDLRDKNAIEVVYIAGYGNAATDVPAPIRKAAYSQLGRIYNDRGVCELSGEVKSMLSSYKLSDQLGIC